MALQHKIFSLTLSALLLAPLASRAQESNDQTDSSASFSVQVNAANGQVNSARAGWTYDERRDNEERQRWHDAQPVGNNGNRDWSQHGTPNWGGSQPAPVRTPPPPMPQRERWPREQGRYELRTVQQWVPGHYEQIWVSQQCRHRGFGRGHQCRGGYYEQRWVPGYYQSTQQWVWVPVGRHYRVATGW